MSYRSDKQQFPDVILVQPMRRPAVLVAALVAGLLLSDELRATDDVDLLEQQAFQAAVAQAAPSVVRIETVGGLEKVGKVLFGTGPTTGLIVGEDGYIISSAFNFINQPTSILVQLPDGTRKPAQRVATDHNRMLVLLKIDTERPLPVPQFAVTDKMQVGQWAIAIGRAFEIDRPNVSVGILSAVNRIWGKAIQADTAISPNNYGGPLVNLNGHVLGVLVPMSPDRNEEIAGVEWYDSGIGFAIPGEDVQMVFKRLKEGKDLHPGIAGLQLTSDNLHVAEPVIAGARPNSPAHKAGLRKDDKIVEIDGRKVDRVAQVKEQISRRYAGDTIALVVLRDNQRVATKLQLVEKLQAYETPFLGILPTRLSGNTPPADIPRGVTVRYVYPDSPAAKAGIKAGDVVLFLAGAAIHDAAELRRRIGNYQPEQNVDLEIRRGAETLKQTITLSRLPEQLPSETLPPATGNQESKTTKQSQTGIVRFEVGKFSNEVWAYIPENYDPAVPHGLVMWFHGSNEFDIDKLVAQWKPACTGDHVILLAPRTAPPDKWNLRDLALARGLLSQIQSKYTVDATRIVAMGQEDGGTLAGLLAYSERETVRAVVAIDAPLVSRPPENDPAHRLAFYVARPSKGVSTNKIDETIELLRTMKYPVSVKDLGEKPRSLNAEEQLELARWLDTLDRI